MISNHVFIYNQYFFNTQSASFSSRISGRTNTRIEPYVLFTLSNHIWQQCLEKAQLQLRPYVRNTPRELLANASNESRYKTPLLLSRLPLVYRAALERRGSPLKAKIYYDNNARRAVRTAGTITPTITGQAGIIRGLDRFRRRSSAHLTCVASSLNGLDRAMLRIGAGDLR